MSGPRRASAAVSDVLTLDPDALRNLLRALRRIAVVGLSPRPERPSHGVAQYLQEAGYRIVPVRPGSGFILGEPVVSDLRSAAAEEPVELVNIFRRSDAVPALVPDCIAIRPKLVWMQLGVRHAEAAAQLEAAGIPVVMDRCLMVDHQRLGV